MYLDQEPKYKHSKALPVNPIVTNNNGATAAYCDTICNSYDLVLLPRFLGCLLVLYPGLSPGHQTMGIHFFRSSSYHFSIELLYIAAYIFFYFQKTLVHFSLLMKNFNTLLFLCGFPSILDRKSTRLNSSHL